MSKLDETRKKGTNTLIALVVIAVAVYLGFTPLYNLISGGVAGAVVGASFGAIFVIILTMYLLNKQTEIEQESKRGEKVFEEKMKIYWDIFESIQIMLEDGRISKDDEMQKLPFVMLKLVAIGNDKVIEAFQKVYNSINNVFNEKPEDDEVIIEDDERKKIMELLGKFANECRVDLGVSNEKVQPKLFEETQKAIEKSGALVSGVNVPIEDETNPVIQKGKVSIAGDKFEIQRHKKGHIRIFKEGSVEPVKNSKAFLRIVDEEYELSLEDKDWKQTQKAGKVVLDKLIQDKEDNEDDTNT
jgi:hypothetical protein